MSVYTVLKAAMNSFTRILVKKFPNLCINFVYPGLLKHTLTKTLTCYLLTKVLLVLWE